MSSAAIEAAGTMPAAGPPAQGEPVVRFVIWPHRALGPRRTVQVAAMIGVLMLAIAAVPLSFGLWPVAIVVTLSYLAFAAAFCAHALAPKGGQTIEITASGLRVLDHRDRAGSRAFDPYWTRVELGTDYYVENRLRLCQSGRSIEVGRCLSPQERADLANAIRSSLRSMRG